MQTQSTALVGHLSKTIQEKTPTQHNRCIRFGTKAATIDIDKAKALNKHFTNVTPYSTNKMKRHIDHTVKKLPTEEI